jgi:hypothetical protein
MNNKLITNILTALVYILIGSGLVWLIIMIWLSIGGMV